MEKSFLIQRVAAVMLYLNLEHFRSPLPSHTANGRDALRSQLVVQSAAQNPHFFSLSLIVPSFRVHVRLRIMEVQYFLSLSLHVPSQTARFSRV